MSLVGNFAQKSGVFGLALLVASGAGCSSDPGGGGGTDAGSGEIEGLTAIRVEPKNAVLVIDGDTPAAETYAAIGTFEDGSERDITGEVTFSLAEPALGAFDGPEFTSTTSRGGRTRVSATAGSRSGTTGLTLELRRRHQDPASDLPADPAEPFSGPEDPSRAPELVYPNDGVLVPPNLEKLEFHFYPGEGNELFELSFQSGTTDIKVYFRCTQPKAGGCIYLPDPELWSWLAESNRGSEPVTFSVRGTDDEGTGVGASGSLELSVSYDDLKGAIYYWTTSAGIGIMRYDFGSRDQTAAEKYVGTGMTGGQCVGCHALSRDGTKMVAEAGGQHGGDLLLLDVATKTPLVPFGSTSKSIFESWSPNGEQFVGVYADDGATDYNLLLFDGTSGMQVGTIDVGAGEEDPADHPDWSPDGDRIVYTRMGIPGTNQRPLHGAIEMVEDLGGGAWSAPVTLVPSESGQNHYYPAFSPDGGLVAFNESRCDSGDTGTECNADTDPTARLYIMEATEGAAPVEMAKANAPGVEDEGQTSLTNSFPKWSPFVFQRTSETGSRLEWITFSSTRAYGLREPPDVSSGEALLGKGTLLWMAAVNPDKVPAGADPSFPAFAIPFQDLDTSNHIAQWTERSVTVE